MAECTACEEERFDRLGRGGRPRSRAVLESGIRSPRQGIEHTQSSSSHGRIEAMGRRHANNGGMVGLTKCQWKAGVESILGPCKSGEEGGGR